LFKVTISKSEVHTLRALRGRERHSPGWDTRWFATSGRFLRDSAQVMQLAAGKII
jgi:hypothetical protein